MSRYRTFFDKEAGAWQCDCKHFRTRDSPCRHILEKIVEQEGIVVPSGNCRIGGVQATSLLAFGEIICNPEKLMERKRDILLTLKTFGPCSDYEIAKRCGFDDPNSIRPRRFELADRKRLGGHAFIRSCGRKQCSITGREVKKWTLTEEGKRLADELVMLKKEEDF